MIAASLPIQRPRDAKLLVIDSSGQLIHVQRSRFLDFLRVGDLVIANDAATLPASLQGTHVATGLPIEVRLAGRDSLSPDDISRFSAVVFGPGDFHTRTEDRPAPPDLVAGNQLSLGPLQATVECLLGHPRLALLRFEADSDVFWAALSHHGHPIQYAHLKNPLALWDTWTSIAGPPVAFEPPSAGFILDWRSISAMRARGVSFATITHAAGISSTGDVELDRRLPFDEPYRITGATAAEIEFTRKSGGRVIAIGTTVVRALEHAASSDGAVRSGDGLADERIDATTHLRVVDAVLSGTHEPDTSHYQLLRAFADDETLRRADIELETHHYRTHEFGDSVFVEESKGKTRI